MFPERSIKPLVILVVLSILATASWVMAPGAHAQDFTVFLPVAAKPVPTPIPPSIPPDMVLVPAGPFQMGCSPDDTQCNSAERPLHTVTLDAYAIDKYEVTNARYSACVAAGSCTAPSSTGSNTRSDYYGNPTYANFPVIAVNWSQSKAFCEWDIKRLPTEAEWEKAARGSADTRIYSWGNAAPNATLLNFDWHVGDTTAVGSYPGGASSFGALDMSGNVFEWVNDRYDGAYYTSSPATDPQGPATGSYRVLRGGAWNIFTGFVRASNRVGYGPDYGSDNVGFRCVRSQ